MQQSFLALLWFFCIPALLWGQAGSSVPKETYYLAKSEFYAGEYRAAEKGFRQALRSGSVRIGNQRWIDSICYNTMLGEVYFHRGQLVQSLAFHEEALKWFLSDRDWLARLQYPRRQVASNDPIQAKIRWGVRPTVMADFSDSMSIREGGNVAAAFQVGGAVNPTHMRRVDAVEVARCMATSLRRRAELLGPTSIQSAFSAKLAGALSNMAAPSGHWSSAWVDVLYGLALLGDGQKQQAAAHLASGRVAGNADHPLSGIALLEVGKILLAEEAYGKAKETLLQASLAAARYGQADVVEESFRYLTDAHLANESRGGYPAINAAMLFAESERYYRLSAALRLFAGEVAVYANDVPTSTRMLTQARQIMTRRDLAPTDLGGRFSYLSALTEYRAGQTKAANQSIKAALAYMQRGSLRKFHLSLVEGLHAAGRKAITPRKAERLYSRILRDPKDSDWRINPLETMTMLLSPHTGSIERWFELLVDRRDYDEAVRVSELLRRHRFYSTLPFGGRIMSLRWLIEGGDAMLGTKGMEQRKHLRAKYPSLSTLSRESQRLQLKLRALPQNPKEDQLKQQRKLLGELVQISARQENIVREIALRREPARLVFPPQPSLPAIQRGMKKKQAILMFVTTSQGWHAWFIRKKTHEYWSIKSPRNVQRGIVRLLRTFGNRDRNSSVSAKDLEVDWKPVAKAMWKSLIGELPSNGWDDLEELVIVPDGVLWYLPFQTLQVPSQQLEEQDEDQTLGALVRVRYAPVASLSVGDNRGHQADLKTTIVGGQLYPRESADHAREMLASLKTSFADLRVASMKKKPAASGGYTAGTMDRLIVWNDVTQSNGYAWSPAQFDRGMNHSQLSDWMEYPWGAPDQMILPGFHTTAETPTRIGKLSSGHEIFLNACALMSTGTRTILLSRWRTGGKAPSILVREFSKELPHQAASSAWQRAVDLVRIEKLDPSTEPRLKTPADVTEYSADHPFFWAGYLLLDTGAEPTVVPPNPPADDAVEGADGAADDAPQADADAVEGQGGDGVDGDANVPAEPKPPGLQLEPGEEDAGLEDEGPDSKALSSVERPVVAP